MTDEAKREMFRKGYRYLVTFLKPKNVGYDIDNGMAPVYIKKPGDTKHLCKPKGHLFLVRPIDETGNAIRKY